MAEGPSAFVDLAHGPDGVAAVVAPAFAAAATEGHFPNEPLLPGSALLELMVRAAEAIPAVAGLRPRTVEHAVFRRRVRPDARIVVTARALSAREVVAHVQADDERAAEARLRFEAPP